ncbi:hypothetical protein KOI35_11360 [Actinoplanes bogorensis]|uniref:Uncharacterized protein n=1 Tax=Paractinoplanes bogorensis TaxID=1610840 RepID=A0ABS5YKT9_9ACTN|nr:hypothetical protein [Actinoplanes bogorensis]MBU2664089.1 hypothetical protein [Actinoplanes bogorensis]
MSKASRWASAVGILIVLLVGLAAPPAQAAASEACDRYDFLMTEPPDYLVVSQVVLQIAQNQCHDGSTVAGSVELRDLDGDRFTDRPDAPCSALGDTTNYVFAAPGSAQELTEAGCVATWVENVRFYQARGEDCYRSAHASPPYSAEGDPCGRGWTHWWSEAGGWGKKVLMGLCGAFGGFVVLYLLIRMGSGGGGGGLSEDYMRGRS